jgi:hypothetical protein
MGYGRVAWGCALALGVAGACARVPEQPPAAEVADERERCAEHSELRSPFFGDLHVHTAFSFDAWSWDVRNDPERAYAFARGEPVELPPLGPDGRGLRAAQLDRPLDFAAVTDHSEMLAEVGLCTRPGSSARDLELCRQYRGEIEGELPPGMPAPPSAAFRRLLGFLPLIMGAPPRRVEALCGPDGERCSEMLRTVWGEVQGAAERAYDRSAACRFTSFVAYEYTASPRGNNLHRNVIFRGTRVPAAPISYVDAPTPQDLWRALREQCLDAGTGCDVLAIPHNSNWSGGQMFVVEYPGARDTGEQAAQARERAQLEPLVEMFQHKGDSECRNGLPGVSGAPDELCDFEKLRPAARAQPDCGEGYAVEGGGTTLTSCLSHRDFARYALVEGLREQQRIGANPFKLGLIASTDTHNGTAGNVEERGFPGHFGLGDADLPSRLSATSRRYNPGGLAGVWAEENARDAIFAALRRRETFGTSGPRIAPRFFGGWDYPPTLCDDAQLIAKGYAGGVPMGGDLPERPAGAAAPVFALSALRDPEGGLLQRLQVIKGWVDADGRIQQRVYDVAGSADNGARVDLQTCEVSGPGMDSACAVWSDPDFDAARPAVYYARIVENASCRYSTRECNRAPADQRPAACDDPELPRTVQERAWTSPIWYTP